MISRPENMGDIESLLVSNDVDSSRWYPTSVDTYSQDGFQEIEHNVFKISIFVDHNIHKVLYVNGC